MGAARRCFWPAVRMVALVLATGCASTPSTSRLTLTGDVLEDGPNAIAHGPPRDRVLWQYRTALAALRRGQFDQAKHHLDEALLTLGGIFGNDPDARKARGYFHAESKKTFIGEPYERSMAFFYRGILYWRDGERDNARACFRSAQFEDSDTEKKEYAGDWVLMDYLDGLASMKLGGDGADAIRRAEANARNVRLPPPSPQANVLLFLDFGPGPQKYAAGEYGQQLRFRTVPSPIQSARVKVGGLDVPVAPSDDVNFQATTRGGRVMDHVLANKAVFKSTTDAVGTVALIGGAIAATSGDSDTRAVGAGIAAAGLVAKLISAATTPAADTRTWDNLPQFISFATFPLPPGAHTATVEFLDGGGRTVANLTKSLSFTVSDSTRDTVLFVSDNSSTPQTQ